MKALPKVIPIKTQITVLTAILSWALLTSCCLGQISDDQFFDALNSLPKPKTNSIFSEDYEVPTLPRNYHDLRVQLQEKGIDSLIEEIQEFPRKNEVESLLSALQISRHYLKDNWNQLGIELQKRTVGSADPLIKRLLPPKELSYFWSTWPSSDQANGAMIGRIPREATLAKFSPNGKMIAFNHYPANSNGLFQICSVSNTGLDLIYEHDRPAIDFSFSPDSSNVTFCEASRLICWVSTETGKLINSVNTNYSKVGFVRAVSYLANGSTVIVGGEDGGCFWNAEQKKFSYFKLPAQNKRDAPHDQNREPFVSIAALPHAGQFVSASEDGYISCWINDQFRYQFKTSSETLLSVCTSSDGELIGALGPSHVHVFRFDGTELKRLNKQKSFRGTIEFSSDSKSIIYSVGSGPATLWNWTTDERRILTNTIASSASLSPDGKQLVCASYSGLTLWSVKAGQEPTSLAPIKDATCFALSPDGELIACGQGDGLVKLYESETGRLTMTIDAAAPNGSTFISVVAFSPDGKKVAAGNAQGLVRAWSLESGNEYASHQHDTMVRAIEFSPSGNSIMSIAYQSGAGETQMETWSLGNGKNLLKFNTKGDAWDASWSPDSRLVAAIGENFGVTLWSARTGKEFREFKADPEGGPLYDLCFSPDSKSIAIGAKDALYVWSITDRELTLNLNELWLDVAKVRYSNDGKFLAFSTFEWIYLVHLENGAVASLSHDTAIEDFQFGDKQLFVIGTDGLVHRFEVNFKLLSHAASLQKMIGRFEFDINSLSDLPNFVPGNPIHDSGIQYVFGEFGGYDAKKLEQDATFPIDFFARLKFRDEASTEKMIEYFAGPEANPSIAGGVALLRVAGQESYQQGLWILPLNNCSFEIGTKSQLLHRQFFSAGGSLEQIWEKLESGKTRIAIDNRGNEIGRVLAVFTRVFNGGFWDQYIKKLELVDHIRASLDFSREECLKVIFHATSSKDTLNFWLKLDELRFECWQEAFRRLGKTPQKTQKEGIREATEGLSDGLLGLLGLFGLSTISADYETFETTFSFPKAILEKARSKN